MSELLETKEITIKAKAHGREYERTFRISKYPTIHGLKLVIMTAELVKRFISSSKIDPEKGFPSDMANACVEIVSFAEVKNQSGKWIRLDDPSVIDAHIPTPEMLGHLATKVHDYNSFFFATERLSEVFQRILAGTKGRVLPMLTQWLPSLFRKAQQPKKNSKQS